jgi:hypothetical protein
MKKRKMRFNVKKAVSVVATALMLGSSVMAASYPQPFVTAGAADAAIVVTSGTHVGAASDWSAAIDLQQNLQNKVSNTGGGTDATVNGEAYELFTSSTKIYINDSIDAVKSVLTDTELETVLADGTFSGNVDSSFTQTLTLGTVFGTSDKNLITFGKQPTSDDDPQYAVKLGTARSNYLYNVSVTFNKAVNLSHPDSEGEELEIFGGKFTIGSASDSDTLVLLKEAEKLTLDSESNPSQEVTISGETYTVELVSASDTSATVRVTDSSGASTSKEVSEAASKKIQGLSIAVTTADETNFKLSASVIAGADKLTFEDASAVTIGEDDTVIDGTHVELEPSNRIDNITSLVVSAFAKDTDADAIASGEEFIDPVFGTFKLKLAGFNIEADSTTGREDIVIENSGDDRLAISFTDHRGEDLSSFQFARNTTQKIELQQDSVGERNISVQEGQIIHLNDYVQVGNEDNGFLLKVSTISNATTGYSSDSVKFTDAISGDTYVTTITSDGSGSVTVGGKVYDVTYAALSGVDQKNVTLDSRDSVAEAMNVYGTIETDKEALVMFYKPLLDIDFDSWDSTASNLFSAGNNLTSIRIPDGDGYTSIGIIANDSALGPASGIYNITFGTTVEQINTTITAGSESSTGAIGKLNFNVTSSGTVTQANLYVMDDEASAIVADPAIIIFEEKDDNSEYHAIIVKIEPGTTSDDGIGVGDAVRTWGIDNVWESITMASDSKMEKEADLWGTILTTDKSDSDQNSIVISYPDEQIYAQLYAAEEGATITGGTPGGGGGGTIVVVKDSEVSSHSDKNLIVVGGSCVNTVAADILGVDFPACSDDFSAVANAGSGQYLIKVTDSPFADSGKVAMLVAGYEAQETMNGVDKVQEGVTTDVGTDDVYPLTV